MIPRLVSNWTVSWVRALRGRPLLHSLLPLMSVLLAACQCDGGCGGRTPTPEAAPPEVPSEQAVEDEGPRELPEVLEGTSADYAELRRTMRDVPPGEAAAMVMAAGQEATRWLDDLLIEMRALAAIEDPPIEVGTRILQLAEIAGPSIDARHVELCRSVAVASLPHQPQPPPDGAQQDPFETATWRCLTHLDMMGDCDGAVVAALTENLERSGALAFEAMTALAVRCDLGADSDFVKALGRRLRALEDDPAHPHRPLDPTVLERNVSQLGVPTRAYPSLFTQPE